MIQRRKLLLGVVAAGLVVALLAAVLGWRRHVRNQPPPPTELALQLASQMVGAAFQPQGSSFSLPYRLHVPTPLVPGRKYPMVVVLHGAGDNGSDNLRQLGPMVSTLIRSSATGEPAFILAPQAPWGRNWVKLPGPPYLNHSQKQIPESEAIQATRALVSQLANQYAIDPARLYVLGFSAGAAGSWDLLTRQDAHPFAAGALLSGAYDLSRAALVAGLPLWFFHGEQDTMSPFSTTLETVEALRQAGGAPRYTLLAGVGHDTSEAALNAGVYAWLLGQRRPARDASGARHP